MGVRFLFILSLILIGDYSVSLFDSSKKAFAAINPSTGLPEGDPLAELEKEDVQDDELPTQDENESPTIGGEEKTVLDKALGFLKAVDPRVKQAISIAGSSQEVAWQNAKRTNASKSRFNPMKASKVVFDFATNFLQNTSADLVASNVAAIRFCQSKGDLSERALKRRALSTSSFKKGIQAGISLANKTKAAFSLPPLAIKNSTCATVKKDFCTNACTKGLCGADALFGAGCVWACWGDPALKAIPKIQQCHMEFTSRFVHGTVADQLNPCATKKLQRSQSGRIRRLYSSVSGEQETFMIAEACSEAMTKGMASPPLCNKVLQTCSLEASEQKALLSWAQQFNMSAGMGSFSMTPMMAGMSALGMGGMAPTMSSPIMPMMSPMMAMPQMPYGGGMMQPSSMMGPMGSPMMGGGGMPQMPYGQQQQMMGNQGGGYSDPSMGGQGSGYDSSSMGDQGGNYSDPNMGGQGSGYDSSGMGDQGGNYSDPNMGGGSYGSNDGTGNYDNSGNYGDSGGSYDDGSGNF